MVKDLGSTLGSEAANFYIWPVDVSGHRKLKISKYINVYIKS